MSLYAAIMLAILVWLFVLLSLAPFLIDDSEGIIGKQDEQETEKPPQTAPGGALGSHIYR